MGWNENQREKTVAGLAFFLALPVFLPRPLLLRAKLTAVAATLPGKRLTEIAIEYVAYKAVSYEKVVLLLASYCFRAWFCSGDGPGAYSYKMSRTAYSNVQRWKSV